MEAAAGVSFCNMEGVVGKESFAIESSCPQSELGQGSLIDGAVMERMDISMDDINNIVAADNATNIINGVDNSKNVNDIGVANNSDDSKDANIISSNITEPEDHRNPKRRRCLVESNGSSADCYLALDPLQWRPRPPSTEWLNRRRQKRTLPPSEQRFYDDVWDDGVPPTHHPSRRIPSDIQASDPDVSDLPPARISGRTISSIGHHFGICPISDNLPTSVLEILAATVEFKVRLLIQEAKKFSRHSLSSMASNSAITFHNVFSGMEAINLSILESSEVISLPGVVPSVPISDLLSTNVGDSEVRIFILCIYYCCSVLSKR